MELAEYLARHAPDEVSEAMNRVMEQLGEAGSDPLLATAGRRVLERTEWKRLRQGRCGGRS
jgi:hypothetical protein